MTQFNSKYVEDVKRLLQKEDVCIWDLGDYLVRHPLTALEYEALAVKVDRSAATLRARELVARTFPHDQWDRSAHSWGVFQELARLEDTKQMARLLKSRKRWTAPKMRIAVNNLLFAADAASNEPKQDSTPRWRGARRSVRLTRDGQQVVANVELIDGKLRLQVGARVPDRRRIRSVVNEYGDLEITIPLDLGDGDTVAA